MNEHTDRAQDRTTITASRGFQGVREAAQKDKGLRFTTLLHHVNEKRLIDSFYLLKRQAAPGGIESHGASMRKAWRPE
jgi:RNA-directed DNA polymerase